MEYHSFDGDGSEAPGSVSAQEDMRGVEGNDGKDGYHDYVSDDENFNYGSIGGDGSVSSYSHQGHGVEDENFDEASLATSMASSKRLALQGYTFVEKKKAITWNPDVSYKKTLNEIKSQMTPAEIYRDRLETVGRLARTLNRLETAWAKDFDRWVRV
jgi:hypothetical protein